MCALSIYNKLVSLSSFGCCGVALLSGDPLVQPSLLQAAVRKDKTLSHFCVTTLWHLLAMGKFSAETLVRSRSHNRQKLWRFHSSLYTYDPHDSAIQRSQHKMHGPATAQKSKSVQAVARFAIRTFSVPKQRVKSKRFCALEMVGKVQTHTETDTTERCIYICCSTYIYVYIYIYHIHEEA